MVRITFPFDLAEQGSLALLKVRMLEDLAARSLNLGFVEVVHIQLSDERRKVAMFKIFWKDCFTKYGWLPNNEAVPFRGPRYDFVGARNLHNLKELD